MSGPGGVWKQTQEYGQRAAGTHPTGMHSCYSMVLMQDWAIRKTFVPHDLSQTFLNFAIFIALVFTSPFEEQTSASNEKFRIKTRNETK